MRRNSVIVLLAALILLGCASAPRHAAAETRPLNIKSMYNMSEEDSMKKVKVEDIITILFSYYGKPIILPVFLENKKIVPDFAYVPDDNSLISRSEINESFSNSR